jgi:FtsZ-interacting cell division protein ZipA
MSGMINLVIPTLILSTIALVVALVAIILVLAQRWSTHRIEWKPLTFDEISKDEEKQEKEDKESDDEILEKALELQKRGKRIVDPLEEITETNNF